MRLARHWGSARRGVKREAGLFPQERLDSATMLRRRTPLEGGIRKRAVLRAAALGAIGLAVASLVGCTSGPITTPPITPGTPASPRAVNVITRDYHFLPAVVDLVPGETVVLHVINGGLEVHEAVFGDAGVQAAWEAAEAATIGAPPGPTPVVSVPPEVSGLRVVVQSGQRVDVTWTVPADGPSRAGFAVGCHIPGHAGRGMVVPVRWVGADGQPLATTGP